jgi:hypothetical protein
MMYSSVSTRARQAAALSDVEGELKVHRRFDSSTGGFSVALQRVAISDKQQRARLVDREQHSRALPDFVVSRFPPYEPDGAEVGAKSPAGAAPMQPTIGFVGNSSLTTLLTGSLSRTI